MVRVLICVVLLLGAAIIPQLGYALEWGQCRKDLRALPLNRLPMWQPPQEGGFLHPTVGLADDYASKDRTPEKVLGDFEVLRQTGVAGLRFGISWLETERRPDQIDWSFLDLMVSLAEKKRIMLLPYVAYTPTWLARSPETPWKQPPTDPERFGRFMHQVAKRYRGKVLSWELWNEPDNRDYWLGDPGELARLVKIGAMAVRRADPAAVLVLGGMAKKRGPFLESLLRENGVGGYVDVVSVHGYLETWEATPSEQYPERLRFAKGLLLETCPLCDFWMAEFGYSSKKALPDGSTAWGVRNTFLHEHTQEFQAEALFRHHVLARLGGVSLTTWYRIRDLPEGQEVIGDDNNLYFGVLDAGGRPKPSLMAIRTYGEVFNEPTRNVTDRLTIRPSSKSIIVHAFEKRSGEIILVGWLPTPPPGDSVTLDQRVETAEIEFPFLKGRMQQLFLDGRSSGYSPIRNGVLSIQLTGPKTFIARIQRTR